MQSNRGKSARSSSVTAQAMSKPEVFAAGPQGESPSQRLERLYRHPGGPLMGWLGDEANRKGHSPLEMSRALGVTQGYVLQLCHGLRNIQHVSQEFLDACGQYLGVPTIVCKVVSGNIRMSDFLHRTDAEQETVDCCIKQLMDDPEQSKVLPDDPMALEIVTRRALVLMHMTVEKNDFLGVKGLPAIVQWLQRCAVDCDEMGGKFQARLKLPPMG